MIVSMSSMIMISIVTFLLVYILFYYAQRSYLNKGSTKFPGPPSLPLIGSALYFMGSTQDILNKCQKLMETYTSPFHVWLAYRLVYFVYDPEQLETILMSTKIVEKGDAIKYARPWVGNGLITAPASIWKVHRKIINPTFHPRILESFVEVFSAKSNILIKEMEIEVNGEEFDIFHYVSLCTLDIVCESAMGIPSNSQTRKYSTYLEIAKRLTEIMYMRMFQVWLSPDFIFNRTKLGKEMYEGIKYVHGVTDDVIRQKKLALESNGNNGQKTSDANPTKRKAFLDLLMELSHEGTKFTDEELREEVNTMMIAGNDTTATVDCFTLLMLASYPEIQDKVYEELYKIYGNEDPCDLPVKSEDLTRMEYLERVIKETMRLFPLGPAIARQTTEDFHMGDYTLKKGSTVILGIIHTHRSEKYWKDPLIFNPDRFLPEECAKRHPYAYIPFSAGPRNCIGLKYAMMAMKTLIATVVRRYILKKDNVLPIEDIKLKADIALKPVDPMKIRIERRIHGSNNETTR